MEIKCDLTFDDFLIEPMFSIIRSRKDVSLSQEFLGLNLALPIISSNMDTVTGHDMAVAMSEEGGVAALHRFQSIETNAQQYEAVADAIFNSSGANHNPPIVSVGVGEKEYQRAMALAEVGAKIFLIDVAHGAAIHVVEMYDLLRNRLSDDCRIIVGNFATNKSIQEFIKHIKTERRPDAFKVGIGPGSHCTTRVVTGCGKPAISSLIDCVKSGFPIIADGGMRNSGDIAKALAAGAKVVMLGKMLAGTDESPGEVIYTSMDDARRYSGLDLVGQKTAFKNYRGSASAESYKAQGKNSKYISPEGESSLIPYTGPLSDVLGQIAGGLRSALSYTGCKNLEEFRKEAVLQQISTGGNIESGAHGKNN